MKDDFKETRGYDLRKTPLMETLSKLGKGKPSSDIKWETSELVPACRCKNGISFKAGEIFRHGEGRLVECSNCEKFERVYCHPDGPAAGLWFGLAASMWELHFSQGITVPAVQEILDEEGE